MSATSTRLVLALYVCATFWVQTASGQPGAIADAAVAQLRDLPTPIPQCCNGPSTPAQPLRVPASEVRRDDIYRQLLEMGREGALGLGRALRAPDVQLRRNAALALLFLGGGYGMEVSMDISPALVDLTDSLGDSDSDVRAWSAQAIGHMGALAVPAVPQLVELLNGDEAARNSACIALRKIGPGAAAALPALRRARSDPSQHVRRFAELAIAAIEVQ